MPPLTVPTTRTLLPTQTISTAHPAIVKTLSRLSRPSLLTLVLDWLDDRNVEITYPYILDENEEPDETDLYPAAASLHELREIYTEFQSRKGGKRDVVDRIIEGDWRYGITLYQLAMADMQYLYDHPTSQKWTALKIVPAVDTKKKSHVPRFHPALFLQNLQRETLPDVKAHYNLDRHLTLPLTILRVFILESPYNTDRALQSAGRISVFDQSKTFYIAFPDASPFVYISLTSALPAVGPGASAENKSLRTQVLAGIPKAFSKPRERYKLESTSFSARNLDALVEHRGDGKTNAAAAGWSEYAEKKRNGEDNPLNIQLPTPGSSVLPESDKEIRAMGLKRKREEGSDVVKRRKLVAQGRFGNTAKPDDGKGIERLDVRIDDLYPSTSHCEDPGEDAEPRHRSRAKNKGRRSTLDMELTLEDDDDEVNMEGWRPEIRVTFHGQHVFAGIRELVEAGIIDGEKMPGWMTGEEGVTLGVIKDGRIRGHKGSGM